MNLIGHIQKNSPVFRKCPEAIPVLCYLLTNVGIEEELLYSIFLFDKLERAFGGDVQKQVAVLEENKYIVKLPDEFYQVGYIVEGKRTLLCNSAKNEKFTDERTKIKSLFEAYKKVCLKTGNRHRVTELKENIVSLFSKEWPTYTMYDVAIFYNVVYELYFQEQPRQFQKKEFGQLKNLFSLYAQDVLVKMVVYYVLNCSDFSKSIPTIGLLLYHKDAVYTKAIKKSVTKHTRETLREETVDEHF